MAYFKIIAPLILCTTLVMINNALPTEENRGAHSRNAINTENDLMDDIYKDCLRKDSVSCVKYKLLSFVDKMIDKKEQFAVTDGVTVVKTPGAADLSGNSDGAPRTVNGDESIESLVFNRLQNFLQTHTIKVDLKGSEIVNAVTSTGRALEDISNSVFSGNDSVNDVEGRGKKKKVAKIIGPLIMAIALKAAALIPLLLGGIALIAGKALLVGKIALVLAAVIGLKKLLSQEKHVTYEVVAHPHHTSSHSSSHGDAYAAIGASSFGSDVGGGYGGSGHGSSGGGGWGRSINVAHDLAYSGQQKQ